MALMLRPIYFIPQIDPSYYFGNYYYSGYYFFTSIGQFSNFQIVKFYLSLSTKKMFKNHSLREKNAIVAEDIESK